MKNTTSIINEYYVFFLKKFRVLPKLMLLKVDQLAKQVQFLINVYLLDNIERKMFRGQPLGIMPATYT